MAAPFHAGAHRRTLPAGTLLTVQLQSSLILSEIHSGDSFVAVLAGPVMVENDKVIDDGTVVSGSIEAIQSPAEHPPGEHPCSPSDACLVRLSLNSITLDGHKIQLQTSSLFAKATAAAPGPFNSTLAKDSVTRGTLSSASASDHADAGKAGDLRILKGRRLTFRLTAPLTLGDASSIAEQRPPDSDKP
jgi:hypothetical protein